MAYNKTLWKDRIVEKPNTYRKVENTDGTITLYPVTGQVIEKGTPVSAANLNKLENGIVEVYKELDNKIDGVANKGTTVAVLERVTKQEIDRQIADGTIANLTIAPGSITKDKLDPNIKFGVEDGGVTKEKIADKAVGIRHIAFLKASNSNPFDNSDTIIGEKIAHSSTYATEKNSLYVISSDIELINATTDINLYVYDRVAFFDETKQYVGALGLYDNRTNVTINMSNYPTLANAKFIKVCIKKEQLGSMYIRQGNESLISSNSVTFEALNLNQKQIDEVFKNVSNNSIPISALKEVKTEGISGIEMEDGYKIAGNGDNGYTSDKFNLVAKNDATTTVFIPINANDNSVWELKNVARVSFFDENETYINSLYDSWNNNPSAHPPTSPIKIFEQFPSLRNTKKVRLSIKLNNKADWSLKIDGVEYFKPASGTKYYIPDLIVKEKNLTESIQEKLSKLDEVKLSTIKDVQTISVPGIKLEEGKKIAGNGDNGYIKGQFTLVAKSDAVTTEFIPIKVKDNSIWEFKNVARISFFTEDGSYIDSLYDSWGSSAAQPPTSPIKMFEKFPTLVSTKKVRLSIKSENKNNWSLKIDGVEYFKPGAGGSSYYIPDLVVKENNLAGTIQEKLSKLDDINKDNSFKNHKDTTIVFKKNKDFASTHFRIPFMCVTKNGTIIAGCDIRYKTWNDHSLIDIGTARSEDGGKTWIDKTVAIPNPGVSSTLSRVMDGTILATKEGRVFLIGNKFNTGSTGWTQVNTPNDPNWDCVLYHSDDDGRTWQFNQSLKGLLPQGQISFLGGVGSGIQMKDGTLVFPIQMARYNDKPFNAQSGIIYSKDNGSTWKMSETLIPEYTSECSVVEYPTGTIMINCRQEGQNHRSVFKTTNFGTTWEATPMNTGTQQTNTCQGHMCKIKVGFDKEVVLFTNPINDGSNRQDGAYAGYDRSNLSLSILQNDTKFTPIHTLYRPHSDGYSCMAFDERRNRLYIVMELEHNLVFRDITDLLPTIQLYKNLEV